MATIFGPDTFTVGSDIDIDDYPSGDPDYAYSRGSGSNARVIAANDNVQANNTGVDIVARCIDSAIPANMGDQEVRGTIQGRHNSGSASGGLAVRYSTTTRGYFTRLETNQANEVRLHEDNAGFTLLASADRGLSASTPYAASLRATGTSTTSLTAIIGGTAAVTFDDTTAAETGSPGIFLWRSASAGGSQSDSWVDDFEVDDLTADGVEGTLTKTLAAATLESDGTVLVSGSLAKTLGAATLDADGAVLVTGTLTKTLDAATLDSDAVREREGTLTRTLGAAALVSVGAVLVNGTLTRTLAAVTLDGDGNVTDGAIAGTLTKTLDNIVTAGGFFGMGIFVPPQITGTVNNGSIEGTLSRTLAAATLASEGAVVVAGSTNVTLAGVTRAADGDVLVRGRLGGGGFFGLGLFSAPSGVLDDATLDSAGVVGAVPITGTLSRTLADATLESTGTVLVQGTLARTLANATLTSSGTVLVDGALTRTLAGTTLASTGVVLVTGTLSATLGDATLVASNLVPTAGAYTIHARVSLRGSQPIRTQLRITGFPARHAFQPNAFQMPGFQGEGYTIQRRLSLITAGRAQ